jgi:phage terminase large subunit-like protein
VRRAVLSIARKNGKTAVIAALVLAHLVGPEAIANGEIYSAANEREQAAQVFKVAAQIVRADPELTAMVKVVDSTKTIACYGNGSFYRAISAEAGTKHGLNPSVVIYDELAQAKNRNLYDVLDTAMGARQEPLFVTISTQSNDPQHILSELIDDGLRADDPTTVTHLYAVPDDVEDIYDESVWPLANPALDDFRSLDDMRAQAARAERMPSFDASFRNLYLNQRVDAKSPLIPRPEWLACQAERPLIPGERIYLGLDLSATTDLTALVAVSAEDGDRAKAWFWKPGDLLKQHEDRDRAPYTTWARQGYIDAPPGRAIDYAYVAQRIGEAAADYEIAGIAYDRWRIETLLKELTAAGIDVYVDGKEPPRAGAIRLVPWGQGYKDMAPAIDALEIAVLERRFAHDGNPVLGFCFSNAVVDIDAAGNRKLDKSKTRFRIDGAVATAMAMGLKARDMAEPAPASPWEDPNYKMTVI